jgi:hypothetical protein
MRSAALSGVAPGAPGCRLANAEFLNNDPPDWNGAADVVEGIDGVGVGVLAKAVEIDAVRIPVRRYRFFMVVLGVGFGGRL